MRAESLFLAVFSRGREHDLAVPRLSFIGALIPGGRVLPSSPVHLPKVHLQALSRQGFSIHCLNWSEGGGYKRSDHSTELNHCGHKMQNTMEIQR